MPSRSVALSMAILPATSGSRLGEDLAGIYGVAESPLAALRQLLRAASPIMIGR